MATYTQVPVARIPNVTVSSHEQACDNTSTNNKTNNILNLKLEIHKILSQRRFLRLRYCASNDNSNGVGTHSTVQRSTTDVCTGICTYKIRIILKSFLVRS